MDVDGKDCLKCGGKISVGPHLRRRCALLKRTHPTITLRDPSGVTRMGGAKAYAAKFTTKRAGNDQLNSMRHAAARSDSRSADTTNPTIHSTQRYPKPSQNSKLINCKPGRTYVL